MSDAQDGAGAAAGLDAQALSAAFAAHLDHQHTFKGQRYALDGNLPLPQGQVATPVAPTSPAPQANERPHEDVAALQQRVKREQAAAWTPARKLDYLQQKSVGDCTRCPLSRTRTKLVFGVGNPEARLVFVGEAPGREEDRSGEPFVGAAGQRLNRWIESLGLTRDEVYIANVLKCRPPNNRDPHPKEVATCSPFLRAQLRAISPRVVVALGRFAGNLLLARQSPLYQMRGRVHEYLDPKHGDTFPTLVTYHPSYVLRRESESNSGSRGGSGDPNLAEDRKSEDQKVLDDLALAKNLLRG